MHPNSLAITPRPTSPVDEDLQQLYNEVWAGFSDEPTSASTEGDIIGIYKEYGSANHSQPSPSPATPVSPHSYTQYGPAPQSPSKSSYSVSSQSAGFRRLPPTPGSSSATSSPTNSSFIMPEPEHYYEQRSSYHTTEPYISTNSSTDLLKKATTGAIGGRRLPQAPGYSNGGQSQTHSNPGRYQGEYPSFTRMTSASSSSPTLENLPSEHRPYGNASHNAYAQQNRPPDTFVHPSSSLDSYDADERGDANGFHDQYFSSHHATSNNNLKPPVANNAAASSSSTYALGAGEYASSPISLSPYDHVARDYQEGESPYMETGMYHDATFRPEGYFENEEVDFIRRPTEMLRTLADDSDKRHLELLDDGTGVEGEYWEDEEEEDENRFVNFSLLSHMAVQLRDKVPRGTHVKGSIPYPRAFTGKDIVSTIQSQIQRELAINHGVSTNDRRVALQVARSLQSQLFFYEVEWGSRVLQDGVEDVYMFLDDQEGGSEAAREREELPTGVVTMLTECYSPSCGEGEACYAYACPRKGLSTVAHLPPTIDAPTILTKEEEWSETVKDEVLRSLPESEVNRQTIIHKIISKEEQYLQDLDIVDSVFIKPLRQANPPVLPPDMLEDFIDDVFGNILDLRECNRRLLEVMYVRQREQAPVIQRIGDIFLDAATEFRLAYPAYIGHHPIAEKRMKDEVDNNSEFRLFLEQCSRQSVRQGESIRLDLKHFLNRPSEHLQKYPVLLEAILTETDQGNPDKEFLREAIDAIKNLQNVAQLRTFQSAMGKGVTQRWEWHDLVSPEIRAKFSKEEAKRQSIIFELIKGEMAYVKDLENIELMYIRPLRSADPQIIPKARLPQFIDDIFHNFAELYRHHRKMVEKFHEIQREQHPLIHSITAAVFDAALNFRESYMEYIPNYPIAAYRIDDEMANNPQFKQFVEQCVRHPDAHRLDMKNFINRPIPRLLRYELLLKGIMDETPEGHEDHESIPQVIDVIKALGKETEPGVFSAKQKVELWRYNSNLVFKPGEYIDMDLLDEHRSLIHSGKLLRQPDSGLEWNGWSELFVLLFDNYLVMTKPKERDGVIKYGVNRRPIPLDLLTIPHFSDPPTQRSTGILRNLRGERHEGTALGATPESATDSRLVYPLTFHHIGRISGPYVLYAESAQARNEWKQKVEEAMGLRKVVQESNKVFEIETLSTDTFLYPAVIAGATGPTWNQETTYTGKVTCSVPFNTPDKRALVAIGCAEGVWIGFRHDPRSMRRVLHLKMVTQCAMLEEFGIFLVLADKSLFAYHIEALVPSSRQTAHTSQVPQKLNGTKDVHFFSVGMLHGRTLIIYMKKKGLDSIFRVLEPVGDKINERVKAPVGLGSRLGFRSAKSEWFRIYRDFFLPSEAFDLIFLKARIAILCAKGFEIMDLNDFNSVTLPQREDPRLAQLAKRCESCRPLGMFRSVDDEFLLCYDEFGVYVDKHGDPCRSTGTIEWEGTAERVAVHMPYVLLFDPRFIEIRHIETGRLVQIIPGNDIRCIWDGRGVSTSAGALDKEKDKRGSAGTTGIGGSGIVQEAQVHAVMNNAETVLGGGAAGGRSRAVAQHVFELLPTIPLYLPGPISAPSTTYGGGGAGPGYGSPTPTKMRMSDSWRS